MPRRRTCRTSRSLVALGLAAGAALLALMPTAAGAQEDPGLEIRGVDTHDFPVLNGIVREGTEEDPAELLRWAAGFFDGRSTSHDLYTWDDYCRLLDYLRAETGPRTRVANVVRRFPFPSVNGPTGRLSPFPAVAGLMWMRWLGPGLEDEFCRSLEGATDAVVVWVPREIDVEPNLKLDRLLATVRRCYRREARFGSLEVWRKVPCE